MNNVDNFKTFSIVCNCGSENVSLTVDTNAVINAICNDCKSEEETY